MSCVLGRLQLPQGRLRHGQTMHVIGRSSSWQAPDRRRPRSVRRRIPIRIAPSPTRARPLPAARAVRDRATSARIASASAGASRSGTMTPVRQCSHDRRDAAGRRRDERRPGRQRLEHDVRQAVDVAAVVAHRGNDDDVGGRPASAATSSCEQVAEEADAVADARASTRCAQLGVAGRRRRRSPPGRPTSCGIAASASIRYSNPFLRTSRPAVKSSGVCVAMPRLRAALARARTGRAGSDRRRRRTGTTSTAIGVGAERDRPLPRGRRCRRSRRRRGGRPCRAARARRPERLGDVHVRSVQADDQRQRRRRRGGDDAARARPSARA